MNLINIAFSGSQAAKAQLNVTSMNTANVHTQGYSRQRVDLSAIGSRNGGLMSPGDGVEVTAIRRISDQYLVNQLWSANSKSSYYAVGQQYISGLEAVMGGESTSIGSGLDKFFAALNAASTQPDSSALRKQIISEANTLATRFNNINEFINTQKTSTQNQRSATVDSINTLSSNIANYNKQITELEANGGSANVMRDERDELVKQLSTLADVKVTEGHDGAYTVTLKDGQPLVSGRSSSSLAIKNLADGSQEIELTFAGTTFNVDMSTGGQLGSLYDYETVTLGEMQQTIASMAKEMADAFNDQLAQGFDLNGAPGKPLFNFDLSNPQGMLQVNKLSSEELALSSSASEPGSGDNLAKLIEIKNRPLNIAHLGSVSLSAGSASLISNIGIASRENQVEAQAAASVLYDAQTQRDNLSGVNLDEEAVNLLVYTQAYQSNLKVMATGDKIFSDLLALF